MNYYTATLPYTGTHDYELSFNWNDKIEVYEDRIYSDELGGSCERMGEEWVYGRVLNGVFIDTIGWFPKKNVKQ